MKKLLFSFCLIFLTASFSNQLLAQTKTCTPEQIAACKKVCNTATVANCTPAQKAACQKVCSKDGAAKVAATKDTNNSYAKLISNTFESKKPTGCSSASSVKLTKSGTPSCSKKSSKVAQEEKKSTTPMTQKVVLETTVSNN